MSDTTITLDTGVVAAKAEAPTIRERDRDTGKLHQLVQEADRTDPDPAKWRFRKKIIDKATGQVLRDEDKPLSEHQGHGSAKSRPNRS